MRMRLRYQVSVLALIRYFEHMAGLQGLEPYDVWPDDLENFPPFPFPMMGGYVPPGWYVTNHFLVSKQGRHNYGDYYREKSLSVLQFRQRIKVGRAYGVVHIDNHTMRVAEYTFTGE